ncbi:hypothetical protein H0X10_04575 [Candidatus Saccharibacteria bacterium]|nr:hypothetical protein [Candidatus Saccharibacteria bacterium]
MNNKPATNVSRFMPYVYGWIAFLLLAHWTAVLLTLNSPNESVATLASWFDLDREYNIPTATSSLLLGLSSLTSLALIFQAKHFVQKMGWGLLAILFSYFALDEILILHEQLAKPVRKLLNITGSNPLYHAWVVPAIGVITFLVVVIFILRRYHKQLRVFSDILLLVAIMGVGVVMIEILGTYVYSNTEVYRIIMIPIEEVFELFMSSQILRKLLAQRVVRK